MAKLGEIATYINGYAFKPSDWSDNGLPIIRIQDLTGKSYQSNRYNGNYDLKYEVIKGDVLISWSASLGIYVWQGEKAILNQHIFKVVFDKVDVEKSFYIHQVENILKKASSEAHGATMKHLTKPVFDSLPFYLPKKSEQIKIANKLDKVCDLIVMRKKELDLLEKLVKSRFIEMFGDPIINSKNLPEKDFIDVVMLQRGFDLPIQNRASSGNVPVYGSNGVLDFHNESKCSNGIITGRSGTIGKVYYCKNNYWPLNTTLFSVNTNGNNIVYLSYLLDYYNLARFHDGTGVPTLNRNVVHRQRIIDVPLELQNEFATFVEQTDKLKFDNHNTFKKLQNLRKIITWGVFL